MNKWVAVIAVIFCIWKLGFSNAMEMPYIEFVDVSGNQQVLDNSPSSPYLIVPWIDSCSFSSRTLAAVESISESREFDSDSIFAFYINRNTNKALASHASVVRSRLVHSAAQEDPQVISGLHESLFEKSNYKPGDVYFVDYSGDVTHIPLRNTKNSEVKSTILNVING